MHGANALNCAAHVQALWTRSTTSRAALLRTAATALALSSAHSWAPLPSPSLLVRTNSYTARLMTHLPFPCSAESFPAVHESVNSILTCCSESARAQSLTWHKLFHACLMPPVSWCTCAAWCNLHALRTSKSPSAAGLAENIMSIYPIPFGPGWRGRV